MNIKSEQKIYRKKCLEIVESVLTEEEVKTDLFLNHCLYMTRNDYNDICIERSLIDLCGYAVCPNKLSANKDKIRFKSQQKYKIDSKNNKIFEIEERKQFCSNLCFKSSNYLKEQISEEPFYLRTGPQKPIVLYDKNCQQMGKQIVFDEEVVNEAKLQLKPKTEKNDVKNKKLLSDQKQKQLIGFPYIKEQYLDQLKDQMKDLRISERFGSKQESDEKESRLNSSNSETIHTKSIKEKTKASDCLKSKLECVESVLKSWITPSTHEFLFDEKVDEITYDMIKQMEEVVVLEEEEKQKKLSEMRYNYMMLCAKLDYEDKRDQMIDEIILGKTKNGKPAKEYENEDITTVYDDDFEAKIEAFTKGKMFTVRKRKVKFEDKQSQQTNESTEHFIPATDSQFVCHKRRQIVLSNVGKGLTQLFDSNVSIDLKSNIKELIKTFHLNASNVSQNEDSVLMALFLVRMLVIGKKVTNSDQIFKEKNVSKALNDFKISLIEIDRKINSYFNK